MNNIQEFFRRQEPVAGPEFGTQKNEKSASASIEKVEDIIARYIDPETGKTIGRGHIEQAAIHLRTLEATGKLSETEIETNIIDSLMTVLNNSPKNKFPLDIEKGQIPAKIDDLINSLPTDDPETGIKMIIERVRTGLPTLAEEDEKDLVIQFRQAYAAAILHRAPEALNNLANLIDRRISRKEAAERNKASYHTH